MGFALDADGLDLIGFALDAEGPFSASGGTSLGVAVVFPFTRRVGGAQVDESGCGGRSGTSTS